MTYSEILQQLPLSRPLLLIEHPNVPYQFARYFDDLAYLGGVFHDTEQFLNRADENDDSYIFRWKDILTFFSFHHSGVVHHLYQDDDTLNLYLIPLQES